MVSPRQVHPGDGLAFRLERGVFPVTSVAFGDCTRYEGGVLQVSREELLRAIGSQPALASLEIELATPGESERIVHILDTAMPMVKVSGRSTVFPGLLGPALITGDGRDHVLRGLNVMTSGLFPDPGSGALRPWEAVVDMSGPAAPFCAFSDAINIVLMAKAAPGASNADYDQAIRQAIVRAARFLASSTVDQTPADLETYELGPCDPELPRVVWINQLHQQGLMAQTIYYGRDVQGIDPIVLHPNEFLDGAIVNSNYRSPGRTATYYFCNNYILLELMRRHGQSLNFLGVAASRGWQDNDFLKQRQGQLAARTAYMLHAEGAILSPDIGEIAGNNTVDFMQTIKACEQLGIRTTAIITEDGNPDGAYPALVDHVPEADAVVSLGGIGWPVPVAPAVKRVIGGDAIYLDIAADPLDAYGKVELRGGGAFSNCWYGAVWRRALNGSMAVDF